MREPRLTYGITTLRKRNSFAKNGPGPYDKAMIDPSQHLVPNLFKPDIKQEPSRAGFGRGLVEAGKRSKDVVALCADLTESTKMNEFAESFPDRFIEVGIAEQNLVTVAAGMALTGKVPFVSSYAAFSPGRNWEQIRTTICLNEANVKVVGSHAGVSVGPDGATHQMLEDIALMRVLPHMTVVVPADAVEAEKATIALAHHRGPAYIRLAREKTPVISTDKTPFSLSHAQVLRRGTDLTIAATGTMVYQALMAAEILQTKHHIDAEVINVAVIKPLDTITITSSARKTGAVLTAEEGQVAGGLGGLIAETLADHQPVPMTRIGMLDRFGESGQPSELLEHFGLTSSHFVPKALDLMKRKG
jgi:transketolase